jgi:ribosome-associated protein
MTAVSSRDFSREFVFSTSRSSGPGGQNVNKVSSKVELRFRVSSSENLTDEEKELIHIKLANHINNAGELIITSQSERSQLKNKEKVIGRFYQLLNRALTLKKARKESRPTFASKVKRLTTKKIHGTKKDLRKKPEKE